MKAAGISVEDLPLQFEVGDSVVEQFALSHTPADILRELVQNEYDAKGHTLDIHFGSKQLVVTGNGNPIDKAGWKRLRVMLGTGRIPNSDTYVEPKESSIGSKNFGLRSLFTVGDEIWVTSSGKWSVLHCKRGALPSPREAQDSPRLGVRIQVPYRSLKTGALEPITPDRRKAWVEEMGDAVAGTLIKLAQPGRTRSLRRVVLTAYGGTDISWQQWAKEESTPDRGIDLVRRRAVQEKDGNRESVVELEYQARLQIPGLHRKKDLPAYFRMGRNRVWIGLSIRLHRGRPDVNSVGIVYYPLGAPLARTGNLVSINAPFEMDTNRANIVSPLTSSWNEWLIRESVDLTVRLLTKDWYDRFGADAYLAVEPRERESGNHLIEAYTDAVVDRLRSERVWASRGRRRGRVTFVPADYLVLPDRPEFDEFFEPESYLDSKLSTNERIVKLSSHCGGIRFGPDSLVRLRCAGEDASSLLTQPHDQGSWNFEDFDKEIRDLRLQVNFAKALDKVRLTDKHKADLVDSATTLAADGSLRALSEPLYVVPSDGWEACPVPLSNRLHPDLAEFRSLRGLAEKFDMTSWIRSTAKRAQEGEVSDEVRRALMKLILARNGKFDAGTLSLLRKSPVLLDHRRNWVEPRKITFRRAKGARELAPVLSFPARSYTKNTELGKHMSFRTKVDGGDLVNLAEWVSSHPDMASKFEAALRRHRSLIRLAQWRQLKEIKCLRSSGGTLEAPKDLYIKTRAVLDVLGDYVHYVEEPNRESHRKMGCNFVPHSADIIAVLEQNRQQGSPTSDALYAALVEALRRERRAIKTYADKAIVWTQRGYVPPSNVLVGSRHLRLFADAVPIAGPRSEKAAEALRKLGCRTRPVLADWVQLVTSISQSVGIDAIVSSLDQFRLLQAYYELGKDTLDGTELAGQPFVLGRDGCLHDPGHAFIDDHPELAKQIGASVPIAQDSSQAAFRFYDSCGIRRLSEASIPSTPQTGDPQQVPNRIGATKTKRQLNSSTFRSALSALINREVSDRPGLGVIALRAETLPRIESIVFVDSISQQYQVVDTKVTIQARHLWENTTLYVAVPPSRNDFRDTVSHALTEATIGSSSSARMLDSAIYRLLECSSTEEIARFLSHRGIPWHMDFPFESWEMDSVEDWNKERSLTDSELITKQIGGSLMSSLENRAGRAEADPPTRSDRTSTAEPKPKDRTLPILDEVKASEVTLAGTPIAAGSGVSGGGGGGGDLSARDPEWERLLGERGEEIIYLEELNRVREAGYESPESMVTWVSRDNPTADHDIRSVAEDGDPLWIEVKSTSGVDGNFEWPESEVTKAMKERERYVLCRVYRVNSRNPLFKRFPDPLSMIDSGHLRMGLGSVRARVEPARTSRRGRT